MFSAAMLSSFYLDDYIFITGSSLIMIGFGCKLLTIFNGIYAGTAFFHTLTACGIGILSLLNETPYSATIINKVYLHFNHRKRKSSGSFEMHNLLASDSEP